MVETVERADVVELPLAPKNPLPYRRQLAALREFHTGTEVLRDAGGRVTRFSLGPRWLMPEIVVATSPQGGRDILGRTDALIEKTTVHAEMRNLVGDNLFDVTHERWLPRKRTLQPVFTKQRVRALLATWPRQPKWCPRVGVWGLRSTSTSSAADSRCVHSVARCSASTSMRG